MRSGDRVRSTVVLPSIPAGAVGTVEEIGSIFVAVRFDDGRVGYYARRQLASSGSDQQVSPLPNQTIALGFAAETLAAGSHLCLLPSVEREAHRIAGDFLSAGLKHGETCVCCASRSWTRALRAVLAANAHDGTSDPAEVLFLSPREVYLPATEFTADKQLARVQNTLSGFPGGRVRIVGRWGTAGIGACRASEWWDYEMRVTYLLRERGATAMCSYDARSTSICRRAEVLHPYAVKGGRLLSRNVSVV